MRGIRTLLTTAATLAATLVAAGCGGSGSSVPDQLTVEGAWARTTPATATNGVAYLTITSPVDDLLTGVDVDASVAGAAELHETMVEGGEHDMATMSDSGGEMTMVPLESLAVPKGEAVTFEPGGKHIMLTDLAAPLTEGAVFDLTLHLQQAGDLTVTVTVGNEAP